MMLTRRRTPSTSPNRFLSQHPASLQPTKTTASRSTRLLFLPFCWRFLLLSLLMVVFSFLHNISMQPAETNFFKQQHSPMRRLPRVVFHSMPSIENQPPWNPSRTVERMGNYTAQRRIKKEDNLHLSNPEKSGDDCKLLFPWQKTQRPNCNALHEVIAMDTTNHIMGNGYWRDVWAMGSKEKVVYKSMRYEHEFTHRNLDRMRRDANVMERMTSSPFIINLYGFCGTSSLSEFGAGGDIVDALEELQASNDTAVVQLGKLQMATQAAIALADLHNVDRQGKPTIAHTDITPGQFIKVNGRFKLNDFNRARFLAWNVKQDTLCPYYVGSNGGKFRSPEEYLYIGQTEKVDVFSLGNIFYMLLQEAWPYDDIKTKKAQELVVKGKGPAIYADLWNSTDPVNQALKTAMMMCHTTNATERSGSQQVAEYLKSQLLPLDSDYETTIAAHATTS